MKNAAAPSRSKRLAAETSGSELAAQLAARVVGQPASIETIVPYVQMFREIGRAHV